MSRTIWVLTTLAAIVVVVACGPSIRRTYQSDNAFERCFDIDYNPARTADDKRDCWSTWLGQYVYNQPSDKIAYAELRLEELEKGISVPGPPGPEGAFDQRPEPLATDSADGGVDDAPETAPGETAVAAQVDAGPEDAGLPELPQGDCEAACKRSYLPCSSACADSEDDACSAACEISYKTCMRQCFAE